MKIFTSSVLALCLAFGAAGAEAQNLISLQKRGTLTRDLADLSFLLAGFSLSSRGDIDYYVVNYTMENFEGGLDTVSGLMVRPTTTKERFPVLVYQHGTTLTKYAVPSRAAVGRDLAYVAATQGYVAIAPDFLNMGDDQEGFHPYVHARSEALAAIRMMEALKSAPEFANATNDQLFLTGYSQGGHASMALHEILVEEFPQIKVTAAAHMSGPYSVSEIMKDSVILKDSTFVYLAFLPYTVLGYQAVYPELNDDLATIFRAPYLPIITRFRDQYATGGVPLDSLTRELLRQYTIAEGNMTYYPSRLLTPAFAKELRDNPDNKYNVALRDNDTYDFVNPTPTRLLYCRGDDQVNYLNSILAERRMVAAGATDTKAENLGNTLNHGECVIPAVQRMLGFFKTFQQITSGTQIPEASDWTYVQAEATLRVYLHDEATYRLELIDALGRTTATASYTSGALVDLSRLSAGLAVVRITDAAGRSASHKLIVQ